MSRYEARPWRPWYLPDSAGWLELSLGARGLVADLLRKFDGEGQLHIRKLSDLSVLLRLDWERELRPAIEELIGKGRLRWDPESGTLTDPDFDDRKRPDSAARARRRASSRTVPDCPPVSGLSVYVPDNIGQSGLSSSSSRSDLGSDLGSREHGVGQPPTALPEAAPPRMPQERVSESPATHVADPDHEAPGWWLPALETIGASTGVDLPSAEAWIRYAGHRSLKRMPPERGDAIQWLTGVMVKEARDARDKARREADREKSFKARFDKPAGAVEHERLRQPTASESRNMADELARRLAALPTPDRKPAA